MDWTPIAADTSYRRIVHMAKLVAPNGAVSPYCVKNPRALDNVAETWTLHREFVTCRRCHSKLALAALKKDHK